MVEAILEPSPQEKDEAIKKMLTSISFFTKQQNNPTPEKYNTIDATEDLMNAFGLFCEIFPEYKFGFIYKGKNIVKKGIALRKTIKTVQKIGKAFGI